MARISLKPSRFVPSGKPWFTGLLVLIALGVWMWNARALWQQSKPKNTVSVATETLPDLPGIKQSRQALPPLAKDPFLGEIAPAKPKPPEKAPKKPKIKKPPPPKPPSGKLLMILKRQSEYAAIFHFRGMDPEVFFEGDRYDHWVVQEITLETVTWRHKPSEKTHVVELP